MTDKSIWENTATGGGSQTLGVDNFSVESRLHVSVNVADLRRSVEFYRVFFGVDPVKVKKGYAKFALVDPPLNFSVNEFPDNISTKGQGHLGVQLKNTKFIREAYERFEKRGFNLVTEDGVECCYAVQSKFWVIDPDGTRWEMFVTTEPEADEGCGPECICHQEMDRSYAV